MKSTTKGPYLAEIIALYPGTVGELAAEMGVARQTVHALATSAHSRVPWKLLSKLEQVLRERGTVDGSKPTRTELGAAWKAGKS